jgi:uncharacterized protein HemX
MINHITEQLHEFKYFDTEGKSRKELTAKLAKLRAMEVKVGDPGSGWF